MTAHRYDGRRATPRGGRATAVVSAIAISLAAGFVGGWAARGSVDRPVAAPALAAPASPPSPQFAYSAAVTASCPAPRHILNIPSPANIVAITFDDGPSVDTTDAILKILAQKKVKATFFETGEHASAEPALVARVAAAGHDVGSHSWSHPHLSKLTPADLQRELEQSTAAVSAATGAPICLMRPPFGDTSPAVSAAVTKLGLTEVAWTDNPVDWDNPDPAALVKRVVDAADGHPMILLLHEHGREDPEQKGPSPTVQGLAAMIDGLSAAGYSFVRVDGTPFPA